MNLNFLIKKWLIIVMCITLISIIYRPTAEYFKSNDQERNNTIRGELMHIFQVSGDRITNIKEHGISDDPTYRLEFDLLPRNVQQSDQPLLNEVQERIVKQLTDVDYPLLHIDNLTKSFGKINFQETPFGKKDDSQTLSSNKKSKSQFVNPSYNSQTKYLNYLNKGFHYDPEIDRSYKYDNKAQIYLEPLPTFPEPTTIPTP